MQEIRTDAVIKKTIHDSVNLEEKKREELKSKLFQKLKEITDEKDRINFKYKIIKLRDTDRPDYHRHSYLYLEDTIYLRGIMFIEKE